MTTDQLQHSSSEHIAACGSASQSSEDENFRLYFDEALTQPSPYHGMNDYFKKARDRMDRTFDLIKSKVKNGNVLDVGASPFYLLDRALANGAREAQGIYFANDAHPLKGIRTIFSKHGQIGLNHVNIEAEDLPFPADSFDVLTACEILEHLEYFPLRFAREIRRVLRPGGTLCFTVPNVSSIGNILKLIFQKNIYMKYRSDPTGRHKHEYTLSQLKALMGFLGFEIVSAGFLPSPTSDKMWLRPAYRAIVRTPGLQLYSPVLYIVGRQSNPKPVQYPRQLPKELYSDDLSIEG
jgi:SAM-dependent methyltransferase